jgi:hypothetical protein
MTPDEQRMIEDFFGRLASQGAPDKDRAAENLIAAELRRIPDAAYLLVQTALVYEHQFGEMEQRIADLEAQVANAGRSQPQGSFLGGRLGTRAAPAQMSPAFGGAAQRAPEPRSAPAASPWGGNAPAARERNEERPSPWAGRQQPPQQSAGGGGFFRSAMATAAGVAGGLMLGDALKGMFGGDANAAEAGKSGADTSGHDAQEHGKLDEQSDDAFFDDMGGGDSFDV